MVLYPRLFEPINIGKVKIKNRIAMAPMGIVGLTDPEGNPTQRAIDYYIERAKGGVGLIITSLFKVDNTIEVNRGRMELVTNTSRRPLGELCDAVHSLGSKIFIQLTAGFGRVIRKERLTTAQPVSASAIPNHSDPSIICRPLETEEIEKLVKAFGYAAEIAAISGMDGIELHGHEGYIFDQFTTPIWNHRTDKYGGDLQGRLTFTFEVLREIRKRVGDDFPVQYRFGLKHYIKGLNKGALKEEDFTEAGRDIEEGLEMAKLLEEAGFDALHVDAGCYDSWYWPHPPSYQDYGCMVDMAAMVKKVVKIPVTAVGKLDIPDLAEKVVAEGKADMIAIGRGLLSDAHWSNKARDGRVDDIRPCIGCHGCFSRFMKGRPLSCAVNPTCARENIYPITRTEQAKKIMIVGGGLAGMEAARVAGLRGHDVTIYEKTNTLGGHLIEATVPDFKKDLKRLGQWYERQVDKLGIHIRFGTEVTTDFIGQENPDAVIVAVGSRPYIPDIRGMDKNNVYNCIDVLLGKKAVGDKVVIAGGGLIGCETALWLAQQGKQMTIVEMLPELMQSGPIVPPMNRVMLLDLLAFHKVKAVTNATMEEVADKALIILESNTSKKKEIEAETIILATGMLSNDLFYEEVLRSDIAQVYAIGDCREVRNVYGAIWDGFEVGRVV
ncbi:MAG: FAD-dependent oxidoreductase [Deltaproteobacteria bacterium]|nr:FAD-dependent oxidoreductase [Deltaproteobacteria bacterium]